ncbi:MAG: NAD(+) synthase [Pseudobutyrivibrio sp.]|nr:NAD(+) synthase [Pseudobutyrivibrio sp.]
MKDGFIKVAAVSPKVRVADVEYNCKEISAYAKSLADKGAKVIVFPELSITGYTCQDLFFQDKLITAAKEGMIKIADTTRNLDAIIFVGLPFEINGKLYNVAAAINGGKIIGIVPKTYLPNYNEFYEARHFYSGKDLETKVVLQDEEVNVTTNQIFGCKSMESLKIAVELCEDLWVPNPPSINHGLQGATLIVNLSASNQIVGKGRYRKELVSGQSARLVSGYVYASAGPGESTQDVVYSAHNIIAENGKILSQSKLFEEGAIMTEVDCNYLLAERRRMTTFQGNVSNEKYVNTVFDLKKDETSLTRLIDPSPFVPSSKEERAIRCNEILSIQAMGLKKRLEHIGCKTAVIGISGGLDSTLALLVTAKAFDLLGIDRSGILAVTMPGFGTTDRTYDNAVKLIGEMGGTFKEINIADAVNQHFKDIEQNPANCDVTYENSQARERTQILMDLANKNNGIVIGTGDLSELALGWATYNGDHMSMYGVNVSVPKTLVRYLVQYYADETENVALSKTLYDILDTPVSPELLPPEEGQISQMTEDLVGPYELHDFFLYHMLRLSQSPGKIYRLAQLAFSEQYDNATILKWEKIFYKRFFGQQYKRSCLPDGPKVGSVAVSPRGDLRMPSDACANIWLKELDEIE